MKCVTVAQRHLATSIKQQQFVQFIEDTRKRFVVWNVSSISSSGTCLCAQRTLSSVTIYHCQMPQDITHHITHTHTHVSADISCRCCHCQPLLSLSSSSEAGALRQLNVAVTCSIMQSQQQLISYHLCTALYHSLHQFFSTVCVCSFYVQTGHMAISNVV